MTIDLNDQKVKDLLRAVKLARAAAAERIKALALESISTAALANPAYRRGIDAQIAELDFIVGDDYWLRSACDTLKSALNPKD